MATPTENRQRPQKANNPACSSLRLCYPLTQPASPFAFALGAARTGHDYHKFLRSAHSANTTFGFRENAGAQLTLAMRLQHQIASFMAVIRSIDSV